MDSGATSTPSAERLSPTRRLLIAAFALLVASAGFGAGRVVFRPTESTVQPVQFNHQKHVRDADMECSTCHEYYATGESSGLPTLEICLGCHAEALTDSQEERKLLALAASPRKAEFKKLFRLPDHVFYSHRRHVTIANLPCERCHGGIAETTAPPSQPLIRITMDTCMGCHVDLSVNNDCTQCHR